MADQKIVTETALSAFASDVKGELINKIGYDELPTISDNDPYNFRPSGNGKGIGNRETDKLIGGSIAFNQHTNFVATDTTVYGIRIQTFTDNTLKISGTPETTGQLTTVVIFDEFLTIGHKYLILCGDTGSNLQFRRPSEGLMFYGNFIFSATSTTKDIAVRARSTETAIDYTTKINTFDLTQMFGSTIADYIYSLEQGNEGAGVAYFRKLFPKYYAYNAGELMSVKTSAHRMVGFNQWDEEWESGAYDANGVKTANASFIRSVNQIPVTPNTTYYYKTPTSEGRICYYDIGGSFISRSDGFGNNTFTTPNDCHYITFFTRETGNYGNNICINLSWNGERNGEYEPYEVNTYPLDSDLELRGIPKLDANNNLYYDGDTYESDGTVTRKYEYRAYASGDESLPDTITDGTHTVTKLVTATTETADTFTNPQIVNDFGTEEYVDERAVAVPVGHETEYVKNMDKLLLPATPSADGTYTLKCTVSGGTPTLSWVADT